MVEVWVAAVILSTCWMFFLGYKAPVGYQDEKGFHYEAKNK
jgi:hypothetical protein